MWERDQEVSRISILNTGREGRNPQHCNHTHLQVCREHEQDFGVVVVFLWEQQRLCERWQTEGGLARGGRGARQGVELHQRESGAGRMLCGRAWD